jgi:hypothetical protein
MKRVIFFYKMQLVQLLAQLLQKLSSQDNTLRQQAEEELDKHWVLNQPGALLTSLADLTANHPDIYVF